MTGEHFNLLDALAELADASPEEREAWLASAKITAEQRQQILKCLATEEKRGGLLDSVPELVRVAREAQWPEEMNRWPDQTIVDPKSGVITSVVADDSLPRFEGYEIQSKLGEGGMGAVYRAVQLATRRTVALKLLPSGVLSPKARARFEREVELAAHLEHPCIARVYDSGLRSGACFYSMELIEGQPLDVYVHGRSLSERAILELFVKVCDAVHHAHMRGIIHRDLKPSNILVTNDGVPHLLDFGIARELQPANQVTITQENAIAGTPAYMSPEQAAGKTSMLDTRTDVYSLGVVLYHLLTRGYPHDTAGTALDVIRRITEQEPARPRSINPAINRELEALMLKALAHEPKERYYSAGDLADDLRNYLAGNPLKARPATMTYFLRKGIRKHRVPVTVGAIVAGLLLGMAVVSTIRVRRERDRAVSSGIAESIARKSADENRQKAEKQQREAEVRMANGLIAEANALRIAQRFAEVPARLKEAKGILESRKASMLALQAAEVAFGNESSPALLTFSAHSNRVVGCGFLPVSAGAGAPMALSAGGDGVVRLWHLLTAGERSSFRTHAGELSAMDLSRDGTVLLTAGRDSEEGAGAKYSTCAWSLPDGKLVSRLTDPALSSSPITAVALSPDRRYALVAHKSGTVQYWDVGSGSLIGSLPGQEVVAGPTGDAASRAREYISSVAFTADGSEALYALCAQYGQHGITHVRLARRAEAMVRERTFARELDRITAMKLAPDGTSVLVGCAARLSVIYDLTTGARVRDLFLHTSVVNQVTCARSGGAVLAAGSDGAVIVSSIKGSERERAFLTGGSSPSAVAFNFDSSLALVGGEDGKLFVFSLAAKEVRELAGSAHETFGLDISPDGRLVASSGHAKTLTVWDRATGKVVARPGQEMVASWSVQFTPDGMHLLTSKPGTTRVFNIADGREVLTWSRGSPSPYGAPAMTKDGRKAYLMTPHRGNVSVISLETGDAQTVRAEIPEQVHYLALSPDEKSLLVACEGAAYVIDAASGRTLCTVKDVAGLLAKCTFSVDGRTAFTVSSDSRVRASDAGSGKLEYVLEGHTAPVTGVRVFAKQPSLLLTGSYDGTARLWDLEARRQIAVLEAFGLCWTVAATPDAGLILTGGTGGKVLCWDLAGGLNHERFAGELPVLQETLRKSPDDAGGLLKLADYYHFRQQHGWAVSLYDQARERGADVPSLALARSLWVMGDVKRAAVEFGRALERGEAPRPYLELCLRALQGPVTSPAQ